MHKDELTGQEVIDYDFFGKGLRPPKKVRSADAGKEINRLLREMNHLFFHRHNDKKKDSFIRMGRGARSQNQLCTAKMFYGDAKKNHIEFLRKYLPQTNKEEVTEKPKLFNAMYDEVPESDIEEYERNATDLHFKYIISPESQKVPLKLLVRAFVKNLEKMTGYSFSWMAAEHHNTDHAHAHLLLNGKDRVTGKEIRIPPEVIKSARIAAGEICTKMIGFRSQELISASRSRLPSARRHTILDDRIAMYCTMFPSPQKNTDGTEFESEIVARNEEMRLRLAALCDMGLAVCFSNRTPPLYYLERNWSTKLRNIGRYNTFIDARAKLRWTTAANLKVFDRDCGSFRGIVTQRFVMNDENVFNNALVVENRSTGEAYYVRTHRQADADIIGSAVELSYRTNEKGRNVLHLKMMGPLKKKEQE